MQEWQIKTLFHNNFSKLGIINLPNKSFYPQQTKLFARARKRQTFGKRLSPSAEIPNHSGNDFRQPRKCQTIRETTFANRGNAKPFKKWFAGGPQASKPLKSDLREARKRQIF